MIAPKTGKKKTRNDQPNFPEIVLELLITSLMIIISKIKTKKEATPPETLSIVVELSIFDILLY